MWLLNVLEVFFVASGMLLWFAVLGGYMQKRKIQREGNTDWRRKLQEFYKRRGK